MLASSATVCMVSIGCMARKHAGIFWTGWFAILMGIPFSEEPCSSDSDSSVATVCTAHKHQVTNSDTTSPPKRLRDHGILVALRPCVCIVPFPPCEV